MKRTSFATWPCSVARTADLIGDWWTPLVLRETYYGTTRFENFERALGIGRNVLTQRLNRLVEEGMLRRERYQDRPVRHEYLLTEKGRDFFPVIAAMVSWGDRWLADEAGPPVELHHLPCGHRTTPEVVCGHCHQPLEVSDVRSRLGPGFPPGLRDAALATGRFPAPAAPGPASAPAPAPAEEPA